MHFMNEYDIDDHVRRHTTQPVRRHAAKTLASFKDLINANSDGWAYWAPPVRAARKLMELVESDTDPTMDALKKALTPIKTFCTRHKLTFPTQENA